jgi:hypothetical protein
VRRRKEREQRNATAKSPDEIESVSREWVARLQSFVAEREKRQANKDDMSLSIRRWVEREQRNATAEPMPVGHYVYAWHDSYGVFYVGRGTNGRINDPHTNQACGKRRREAGTAFRARIVRDNLTLEGSILVESVLIAELKPACNRANGTRRQEVPPLTADF